MKIFFSHNFLKESKELSKKYKLLKSDLKDAIDNINGDLGVSLGADLYKKRIKNSSIPTGKSGGFRVIIFKKFEDELILLSIFSKSQKDTISDEEIEALLKDFIQKRASSLD